MACNFLRRLLLECFGGELNNTNGNGNMSGSLLLRRFMLACFGGEPQRTETSCEGSSGNTFIQLGLTRHMYGMFSMAVVGPPDNSQNEDRCQLVSGSLTDGVDGVFVGIYDGHGGTTCSQFVLDHLLNNFKGAIANQNGLINAEVFQEAYHRTELMFVNHVRTNWHNKPQLAVLGSCCLVGVVFNNVLYVANAGDSRAVLARWPNGSGLDDMEVIQLSVDYNAKHIERRNEVCEEHPGTNLFPEGEGSFLLRGSIHVTRAIGHVYLKYEEFNRAPLPAEYIQEEPIVQPIVKAEPTVRTHQLGPDDRFIIFASDGLWDVMNNKQAADLVKNNPRNGAAAKLMREAMKITASKYDMEEYHNDMSIVILFFDNLQAPAPSAENPLIDLNAFKEYHVTLFGANWSRE
ncbi:hypothetical protein FCM35_KLT17378 [Carex littledalei]|uniref:protein-serine/threonine phosphatase n=1 Tax=Carex littledalei TaxID=544730 RepID=A0A833RME7_9POAL|nr:hypothetical protein FCM35_KLT17378 [Carex littledalei]